MFITEDKIKALLRTKKGGLLYHRESQTLEFKEQFNFGSLADYLCDFAAFANNKGGYIVFGVKDKPYKPQGINENALDQFQKIDPEKITGFLNEIFDPAIEWEQTTVIIKGRTFAVFYIFPSKQKPIIAKKNSGKGDLIKDGEIYYRYGGRTQKIQFSELQKIINDRLEAQNKNWQNLVSKIAKAGPENAAILDTERGLIEKDQSKTLVIDSDLVKKIKFIKEGDFQEKKGETTLRLVGDVEAVDSIEIRKIEKKRLIDDYPYSALELFDEVRKRVPIAQKNRIWEIIKDNDLKDDKNYSSYNFRNKKQENDYNQNRKISASTPSIYNKNAVEFIVKVLKQEKK